MAGTTPAADQRIGWVPANGLIGTDASGRPCITGWRCMGCAAVLPEQRIACPACGSTAGLSAFAASGHGRVRTYTIVHRSYPGVAVPFISVVVALDEGFTVKANLCGVPVEPSAAIFDMPVRIVFDMLAELDGNSGAPYLAYHAEPAGNAQ